MTIGDAWDRAWPAPAKINLFLHVVGRRADGYHLLQTVFRFLDFGDSLRFAPRDDGQIVLATPLPGVPAEADLTVRAARLLREAAGAQSGATIALEKRLPMGGGLGGGSSDAATTLVALNRLWNCGLSIGELQRLGLALGADVPVFVHGRTCFAEGVGGGAVVVQIIGPPAIAGGGGMTRDPAGQAGQGQGKAEHLGREAFPVGRDQFLAVGRGEPGTGRVPGQLGHALAQGGHDENLIPLRLVAPGDAGAVALFALPDRQAALQGIGGNGARAAGNGLARRQGGTAGQQQAE
jgi:hypothetical protein